VRGKQVALLQALKPSNLRLGLLSSFRSCEFLLDFSAAPGVPYLPNVMSKFMLLGFSLEQVVTMTTTAPAKIINRAPKIGTLQIGAPGDVAIMELVEGPVSFLDTRNNKRDGKAYLKPIQTVINGVPFGRPYQSPFSVK
jgi:dihydroorotase